MNIENLAPGGDGSSRWLLPMVLVLGVVTPIIGTQILGAIDPNGLRASLSLHSSVEVAGAVLGLVLATILLFSRHRACTTRRLWIASALISMAVLDIFHSFVPAGLSFVWLHSLAVLTGGIFFALVWLPERELASDRMPVVAGVVLLVTLLTGLLSTGYPEILPAMVDMGKFTPVANTLNFLGGGLTLFAALNFAHRFYRRQDLEDLFFLVLCLLFGLAGIIFQMVEIWEFGWWFWHLLRLAGYGLAFWLALLAYRRSEDEMLQAHSDLSNQFNAAIDGKILIDADFNQLRMNDSFAEMAGVTTQTVNNMKCYEVFPGALCHTSGCPIEQFKRGMTNKVGVETTKIRMDGESLDCIMSAEPLVNLDGSFRGIIESFWDISEIHEARRALKREQQRLDYIFNATQDGIWDWDRAVDDFYCSPTYFEMLGYGPEAFPVNDSRSCWLEQIHPDDLKRVQKTIDRQITESDEPYSLEFRMRCKDGSYKWILNRGQVVDRNALGEAIRLVGVHVDIDSFKKLEKDLRQAKAAADAANRAKSLFLANMSHELRTPLNAVLGFSQIMQSEVGLNSAQKSNLEIINRSGYHLLRLINDVLDMSKIEAGKTHLEVEDFDLGELLREVIDMMRIRAQNKGLQLQLDQSSEFPRYIQGDASKIRQILINLLSNAVKFTDRGEVTLRLDADRIDAGWITLHGKVVDSGRGINSEDIERIFQPFKQLADAIEQRGTGLGLSITRQFVELMNGRVSATSQPGEGSTFHFYIKVEQGNPSKVQAGGKREVRKVIGLQDTRQEWRILIAEDHKENQQLLQQLLEQAGFQVRVAGDGEKTVQAFLEWHPHFIWMDRRMPRMDGLTATKCIHELPGGKDVKIAALTASVFKEERALIMAVGSDDYVRKPYRPEEIFECMAKHLGIQYCYEEVSATPSVAATIELITPERLSALPKDLLEALDNATTLLDLDLLHQVLERIDSIDPELTVVLRQLVDGFDLGTLKRLLVEGTTG
ncbi:MAG: ATP-binding protein [Sedimenticola sp.]